MKLRASVLATIAMVAVLPAGLAQMSGNNGKPLLSPAATASVQLGGKQVTISYNAPSMRGRKIFGGLVPYGQVWRTGANAATTMKTDTDLKIGGTTVPAGTYTLYTLPTAGDWTLIINKQTGQWGTKYDQDKDLARMIMEKDPPTQPQEKMTISFQNTHFNYTQLHIRWAKTDVWVPVIAEAAPPNN